MKLMRRRPVTVGFSAGPVLKDGETLGVSETERFRVAKAEGTWMILTMETRENGHA